MPRKLPSFLDGFLKYTEGKGSPLIWRKWAAIFLVSSAMERKVWVKTAKGKLFANQYIVLTGGAGSGKSLMTNLVHELLSELKAPDRPFHLAPTSMTTASLIDALAGAERRVIRPLEGISTFHALTVIPNEFGVFIPAWDPAFMSTLTDLWDSKHYSETRRGTKLHIEIKELYLNIFSATTPAQLYNLLPEGAWEQGFMSRILLIFSGENIVTDLFAEFEFDDKLRQALIDDLADIYKMWGEMTVTDEAKAAIQEWARKGGEPIPDHPKLMYYVARRAAHLLKLCVITSAAQNSDRVITIDHFAEALDLLVEAESFMPDIFKSMKTGGDSRAIEECYHFAYQIWMKENRPIMEHRLHHFLMERVPAHNVGRILEVMERARLIEKKFVDGGGHGYVPRAKRAA